MVILDVYLELLPSMEPVHMEAAKALAGSLIDAIPTSYFGKHRYKYIRFARALEIPAKRNFNPSDNAPHPLMAFVVCCAASLR